MQHPQLILCSIPSSNPATCHTYTLPRPYLMLCYIFFPNHVTSPAHNLPHPHPIHNLSYLSASILSHLYPTHPCTLQVHNLYYSQPTHRHIPNPPPYILSQHSTVSPYIFCPISGAHLFTSPIPHSCQTYHFLSKHPTISPSHTFPNLPANALPTPCHIPCQNSARLSVLTLPHT